MTNNDLDGDDVTLTEKGNSASEADAQTTPGQLESSNQTLATAADGISEPEERAYDLSDDNSNDSWDVAEGTFDELTEGQEVSSELDSYESAEIEDQEYVEVERIQSIIESLLFATDKPQSLGAFKQAFKGTNVTSRHIKRALDSLAVEYAGAQRGISLEEVHGGYQLRTKIDNMDYLRRLVKAKTFKLSGPALEVLAIAAYKQPITKSEVDEIRGVESGHLMRGLMDRGLICFNGKSELPGKPMLYGTTKKFLEIFGLRNLKELPSLSEIDDLLPEGIGEEVPEKETLSDITDSMSTAVTHTSYSEGEEELEKINSQLADIQTSSDFFEQEKERERQRRDQERAQDIRERLTVGEGVEARDVRWLERYEQKLAQDRALAEAQIQVDPTNATEANLNGEPVEAPDHSVGSQAMDFEPSDVKISQDQPSETNQDPLVMGANEADLEAIPGLLVEEGIDAFALAEIEAAIKAFDEERGGIPVDEVAEAKEFGPSTEDLAKKD